MTQKDRQIGQCGYPNCASIWAYTRNIEMVLEKRTPPEGMCCHVWNNDVSPECDENYLVPDLTAMIAWSRNCVLIKLLLEKYRLI